MEAILLAFAASVFLLLLCAVLFWRGTGSEHDPEPSAPAKNETIQPEAASAVPFDRPDPDQA